MQLLSFFILYTCKQFGGNKTRHLFILNHHIQTRVFAAIRGNVNFRTLE